MNKNHTLSRRAIATLTAEKLDILRQIFWDMNAISYWVETVSGDEDERDTVILHITVTVKDHLQMADEYRFNIEQRKLLEELMQPEYQELFMALTGRISTCLRRRSRRSSIRSPPISARSASRWY